MLDLANNTVQVRLLRNKQDKNLYATLSFHLNVSNPLSRQLEHYKVIQNILAEIAGRSNALSIISSVIYLISAGNHDFIQNYYVNPLFTRFTRLINSQTFSCNTMPISLRHVTLNLEIYWQRKIYIYLPLLKTVDCD